MYCTRLAENTGRRKSPKIAIWAPSHNFVGLSALRKVPKACIDNRKKNLLNINTSFTCPHNMVNFGPLTADIGSGVWGTPIDFNGFRVLAAILHVTASAKPCGVEKRAPPIFGRAAITLGIGPHSSILCLGALWMQSRRCFYCRSENQTNMIVCLPVKSGLNASIIPAAHPRVTPGLGSLRQRAGNRRNSCLLPTTGRSSARRRLKPTYDGTSRLSCDADRLVTNESVCRKIMLS